MQPELWAQEELGARRAQPSLLPLLPLVLPRKLGEGRGWLLRLQQHQSLKGSPWVCAAPPPAQATSATRYSIGRAAGLPESAGFLRPLLEGSRDLGQL